LIKGRSFFLIKGGSIDLTKVALTYRKFRKANFRESKVHCTSWQTTSEQIKFKNARFCARQALKGMTAIANPDLSDIDLITMKRLRLMSSLSVAIFGLMGLGFFIILHGDEKISRQAQHRQNAILAASGIVLLAGGILLLVLVFWGSTRSLNRLRHIGVG
jgi:hypothetical protein